APGAAAGIAIGVCLSSVLFIVSAARTAGISPTQILGPAGKTLTLPAILEGGFFLICVGLHWVTGWMNLIFCVVAGLAIYALAFYAWSTNPVEKQIASGVLVNTSNRLYSLYTTIRLTIEKVPPLRTDILSIFESQHT